jgi:serine/threonine protein kinase
VRTRAQIFHALGALLFEMTTGRRPFSGDDVLSLLYQIAHEPAPLLRVVCRSSRTSWRQWSLAASKRNRCAAFPTRGPCFARCVANPQMAVGYRPREPPLPAPLCPAREGGIRSLVVLPFESRSGDPDQEFFADGMTYALIADLAQIAALRVISRTSAMRFKGTHPPLSEIARELRVDGVVEG